MTPWGKLRLTKAGALIAAPLAVVAIGSGSLWGNTIGISLVLAALYPCHNFRCPSCQLRFFSDGNGKVRPFSAHCAHCGQRIGSPLTVVD